MSTTTTIKAGDVPQTINLAEGKALILTGAANTAGVAYLLDLVLGGTNSKKSWVVGVGALAQIGPYADAQKIRLACTAGSITAVVQDAVLTQTGGSVVATITGTPTVGQPLTATLPAGVTGTLQFTRTLLAAPFTKSNIANAVANAVNSLVYTPQLADTGCAVGCDVSNAVTSSVGVTVASATTPGTVGINYSTRRLSNSLVYS